ncbi:MAG: MraY family glycosyltransferase [Burkholderiaceae bacterium]|uniref:MraY family glycosyltransferase n=1 Tax=Denitratimonas sp. CY0512 TaxID=3131940 RepID=UPI0030A359C3
MSPMLQTAIGGAGTFVLAVIFIVLLLPHAGRLGLVDHPAGRKAHAQSTPVIGGLAMLLACALTFVLLPGDPGRASIGFGLAAILITVVGAVDDRYDIPWHQRIVAQIIAALIMIYVGGIRIEQVGNVFGFGSFDLGVLSVPFTVFATVGIINAVNMIDGEDGLAGSLVLAALAMMGAAALYSGNDTVFLRIGFIMGAVAGFLLFNMRLPGRAQARIFMGNAGSALLGLTIACFAFRLTQNPGHPVGPILALWLIPIPIMDCLVLMVRRIRSGRSPAAADRGHIHHLMRQGGFSVSATVFTLVGFSLATGLLAAVALLLHVPQLLLALAFVLMSLGYYWLTSRTDRAVAFFSHLRWPRKTQVECRMADTDKAQS